MLFRIRKKHSFGPLIAVVVAVTAFSLGAYAAPSGKGNGSGGGSGNTGGGSQAPDLGDLYVLYRNADGIPILSPEGFVQPLAAPAVRFVNPDGEECQPPPDADSCVIPVDPTTGAVLPDYVQYVQEVDFGRTSAVRSPASVLDSALEEATSNLATADCKSLDPAGRLVTSTVAEDGALMSGAIDSPIENLAMYRQFILTGYLGSATSPMALPGVMGKQQTLTMAARALGAAADKTGKVGVDMVVYINRILGLTEESVSTYLPKICIDARAEVQGVVQTVRKCYLNYSGFGYNRAGNFDSLPYPAYIPAGDPTAGTFEYLSVLDATVPTFHISQGSVVNAVPSLSANSGLTATNIVGFAQAADDTRAVINFMHTWPVPGDYATQVPCTASGETHSDVSISDKSGLEVPVRMVANTEGREFTLTVANAGPDAATGTVTLEAVDSNNVPIEGFPRYFELNIATGATQSWTGTFSVAEPTTITWTATATVATDVNTANNSVTESTVVMAEGSGHGGGGG